jgi:pantetheine-phosphate adenylyltransferase
LFGSVTVAIAENIQKTPLFSVEERLEMLRAVLREPVEVTSFGGLVVDCAGRGRSPTSSSSTRWR